MIPIRDLRPKGETAADYRDALDNVVAERAENSKELTDIIGSRAKALLEGTTADVNRVTTTHRALTDHAEALNLLEGEIKTRLEEIKKVEGEAEFDAAHAEAKRKTEVFKGALERDYVAACETIIAILNLEREAIMSYIALGEVIRRLHGRNPSIPNLAGAMPKSFMTLSGSGASLPFALSVKLPNLKPGPALWDEAHSWAMPADIYAQQTTRVMR